MGLLDLIEGAINEHGSAAIMRERLELIRDHAQALEKKMADLQHENTRLKKRMAELEADIAAKTKCDEFVEHRAHCSSGSRRALITMRCSVPTAKVR
jgi:predicted nuclease with TOPRIM domain